MFKTDPQHKNSSLACDPDYIEVCYIGTGETFDESFPSNEVSTSLYIYPLP